MAQQQFYKPPKRSRDLENSSDGVYDGGFNPTPGLNEQSGRVLQDADNTLGNIDDALGDVGASETRDGLYNSSGDDAHARSASDLASAEQGAAGGRRQAATSAAKMRKNLSSGSPIAKLQLIRSIIKKRRNKKAAAAGGILVTIGVLIIGGILMMLPLKILHIVNNAEDIFYSNVEAAAGDMADALFRDYAVNYLVPGMVKNNCTSTRVSRSCADVSGSSTIVGVLFASWSGANIEGKMADKGVEIRREGNRFFLRTPGLNNDLDLGNYDANNSRSFEQRAFRELSRGEVRREISKAFESETFHKRMLYRFTVGNLVDRKYGVRRCVMACNARDKFDDSLDLKKTAFKAYLAERVLVPRTASLGIATQCALSGFNCVELADADANGQRLTQFERDLQVKLREFRRQHGNSGLAELDAEAEKMRNSGFVDYAVRQLAGDTVGKFTTKAIPFVGWIDLGATVIDGAQNADDALQHMNYVMIGADMVAMYALYRSHADEIKDGSVDSAMVGSMTESLSADPENDQGGASAEQSPLYSAAIGTTSSNTQTASLVSSIFPSAYAAETNSSNQTKYTCDNGEAPANGALLCPEEMFGTQSLIGKMATTVSSIANDQQFFFAGLAADIWRSTVGAILDALGKGLGWLVGQVTSRIPVPSEVTELINWVTKKVVGTIFINPVTEKPSGARNFNMLMGGADVSAQQVCRYQLGCRAQTPEEYRQSELARVEGKRYEFNNSSIAHRLFSTEDSQSLLSRTALALPTTSLSGYVQKLGSLFINPFKILSIGSNAAFADSSASAAGFTQDPFGLTTYWMPPDDPVLKADNLTEYWVNNDCDSPDNLRNWGDKATRINPITKEAEQDTTNGCMLLRHTIGNVGGRYDSSLIVKTADDGGTTTVPLDEDIFEPSDTMLCPDGTREGGLQEGYRKGNPVRIKVCAVSTANNNAVEVNARLAQNMKQLFDDANAQGLELGGYGFRTMQTQKDLRASNCRGDVCKPKTAKPGFSNHQMGLAIDFTYKGETICHPLPSASCTNNAGFDWLKANASRYGLKNLPDEAWHWSVDGS